MSTNTMVALATTTLSSANTITFSSIPQTYTDLVLVANCNNGITGGTTQWTQYRLNGDSATNYSHTVLYGNGGGTGTSNRASNYTFGIIGYNSNSTTIPSQHIAHFMNYANTTTYKTIVSRFSDSAQLVGSVVNLWRSTAAITSIVLYAENLTNFAAGSTFTLYAIQAA